MRTFFTLLTLAANVAVLVAVILAVGARFSVSLDRYRQSALAAVKGRELTLAFVVGLVATLGSLYLSEIAHLVPCTYCWYQRIAMYPLPVILGIAAWRRDQGIVPYASALAVIGVALSGYHYLVQHFPNIESGVCSGTVPCTAAYFWQLGYITIPFMALSAFLLILVLMTAVAMNRDENQSTHPQRSEAARR